MAQYKGSTYKLHISKAIARAQGSRDHQEDQFAISDSRIAEGVPAIYCVFDGHGGDQYSIHAAKHMCDIIQKQPDFKNGQFADALRNAFYEENEEMRKTYEQGVNGGTTATVALVSNGMLYLGNVGDSRSVMGISDEAASESSFRAIRLSKDHSFTDRKETMRIIESGGNVSGGRVRQNGHGINMTRALGDFDFKNPYNNAKADFISAVPHITSIPLSPLDNFLILASDGIWGALEDQQIVNFVTDRRSQGMGAQQIAEELVSTISHMKGSDNVTVILLLFDWDRCSQKEPIIETTPTMQKLRNSGDVELYVPVHSK